jgi:hypothetical protein
MYGGSMFLSLVSAVSTKFIIPDTNWDFDFIATAHREFSLAIAKVNQKEVKNDPDLDCDRYRRRYAFRWRWRWLYRS